MTSAMWGVILYLLMRRAFAARNSETSKSPSPTSTRSSAGSPAKQQSIDNNSGRRERPAARMSSPMVLYFLPRGRPARKTLCKLPLLSGFMWQNRPGNRSPAFNCDTCATCINRRNTPRIVQDVQYASSPPSMGKRGTPLMQTCIKAFLHAICLVYQSAQVRGASISCQTASQPRINCVSFWTATCLECLQVHDNSNRVPQRPHMQTKIKMTNQPNTHKHKERQTTYTNERTSNESTTQTTKQTINNQPNNQKP